MIITLYYDNFDKTCIVHKAQVKKTIDKSWCNLMNSLLVQHPDCLSPAHCHSPAYKRPENWKISHIFASAPPVLPFHPLLTFLEILGRGIIAHKNIRAGGERDFPFAPSLNTPLKYTNRYQRNLFTGPPKNCGSQLVRHLCLHFTYMV